MESYSTAKLSLIKKELVTLISIVEKEKEKFDTIDYDQLDDDEAGDVGDEHEVVNGLLSMLKIVYSDTFE
jgi:hypothetical protein